MLALVLAGLPLMAFAQNSMCAKSAAVVNPPGIDPNVFTWVEPSLPWGTTPDSINPNGFRSALIRGENEAVFCLDIPDSADRMVQVLIETNSPSGQICVADKDFNPLLDTATTPAVCETRQISHCFAAPTSSDLSLMMYLPTGIESDLGFQYKIRVSSKRNSIDSTNSAVNNIEMWCGMISGSEENTFPSQLGGGAGVSELAEIPREPVGQNTNNAASSTSSLVLFSVMTLMIALF